MVKRFLFKLLIQNSGLIFNSIKNAYRSVIANAASKNFSSQSNNNSNQSNQQSNNEGNQGGDNGKNNNNDDKENKSSGSFGKYSLQNLIASPMTRQEALKILDITEEQSQTPKEIMERFDKLMKLNDPEKGGSFYIQNKIYYAKEYLMEIHSKDDNVSEYNPKI